MIRAAGADPAALAPPELPAAAGPPVALYVHVPFCLSICPWCDFAVYRARRGEARTDAFVAALHTEIDLRADGLDERWPRRPALASIYFGGGTPSLLGARQIAALVDHAGRRFGLEAGAEITLEANPGPDDRGDVGGLVAAGVNRLSFGTQSLDIGELRQLGRRHSPDDVGQAVAEARRAGARSISLDLLYDVPDGSVERWARTLDGALAMEPDHLSLYGLSLDDPEAEGLTGPGADHLPVSAAARSWRRRARRAQNEDRAAAQYRLAVERLGELGWYGYEISSWARPGHESRHNRVYWTRQPYEAVGPGAHAFDGQSRRWNGARLDAYLAALLPPPPRSPSLPPGSFERLDPPTAAAEAAILALRTSAGLRLSSDIQARFGASLEWGLDSGLLERLPGERVGLTTAGRLLSNELFVRLL